MLTRRVLATVCLGAIFLSSAAACGTSESPTQNTAPTFIASSAPVSAATNTTEICNALSAAMAPGQAVLLSRDNTVASATAVLTGWAAEMRSAAAKATDPQLTAALVQLAGELDKVNAKVVAEQNLNNWGILMSSPEVSAAWDKIKAVRCKLTS